MVFEDHPIVCLFVCLPGCLSVCLFGLFVCVQRPTWGLHQDARAMSFLTLAHLQHLQAGKTTSKAATGRCSGGASPALERDPDLFGKSPWLLLSKFIGVGPKQLQVPFGGRLSTPRFVLYVH